MYVTDSYTQIAKDSRVEQLNRPFHGFFSTFFMGKSGKIRRLCWKKRLKISEIANFESDLLKSNIRYSSSESRNFTKICTVGGYKLAPHRYNRLQIIAALRSYVVARFRPINFKLAASLLILRRLFQWCRRFSLTGPCQKNRGRVNSLQSLKKSHPHCRRKKNKKKHCAKT